LGLLQPATNKTITKTAKRRRMIFSFLKQFDYLVVISNATHNRLAMECSGIASPS